MNEPAIEVSLIRTRDALAEALAVRRVVFIEGQHVPESEEIDAHDGDPVVVTSAVHVLARRAGRAVGTGRLLLDYPRGEHAHIGRVAVLEAERRHGVGRAVMRALEAEARARGFAGITLAAQLHAVPFYLALGYVLAEAERGAVFLDAGIEHRWMDLAFGPRESSTPRPSVA